MIRLPLDTKHRSAPMRVSALSLLALWQLPESRTPDSASARRALLDWQGLRLALAIPSIAALLLASFIVVLALAAFESTLALAIEALHESALADLGGGGGMDRVINWMTALGYGQLEENRLAIVLGTFAYLGLVMALAVVFTGSLPAAILMHAVLDIVQGRMLHAAVSTDRTEPEAEAA